MKLNALITRPFRGTSGQAGIAMTEYVVVVAALVVTLLVVSLATTGEGDCAGQCPNVFSRVSYAMSDALSQTTFLLSMPF